MKTNLLVLLLLVSFTVGAQQINKQLTAANGRLIGFLEYKPTDYQASDKNTKYPLIIFLHGMGERGNGTTDLNLVAANAIPRHIKGGSKMKFTWKGKTETFLVLSPQLSTDYSSWPTFYAEEMIRYAKANLNIDTNRIILTGISLGGGGTWYYAASDVNNTKKLAAIGISCGTKRTANYNFIAEQHLPTWAFHAIDDPTVSVSSTTSIIQTINNYKPTVPPYKTIWSTGGHAIWDMVYDTTYKYQNPNIYEWFLAQNKSYNVNIRPTANVGNERTVSSKTGNFILNASGSSDVDGTIQRFIWKQIAGPTTVLTNAISKDGICNVSGATNSGVYKYELKVIDDRADYTVDTVSITSDDIQSPPVSIAGADQVITLPVSSVFLDGRSSSDADGTIASYSWTKLSGPTGGTIASPTSSTTTISALVAGTFVYRLTVKDNIGAADSDDITITVSNSTSTSSAPIVNAGADQVHITPENAANLTATATDDGTISSYLWTQVSGPSTATFSSNSSMSTNASGLVLGRYTFNVKVTDNAGLSTNDQLYVDVKARPIAKVGADKTITGTSTSLSSNGSIDPDGTIVHYEWFQKSGPGTTTFGTPNGASTTVSSLVPGSYFFYLRVRDNDGYTDTDGLYVHVTATSTANLSSETSFAKEQAALTALKEKIVASPNPVRTTTKVTVSCTATGKIYFNVYDLNGKLIKRISTNKSTPIFTQPVDMSGLLPGSYQIQAQINNTTNLLTRVIKQ